MNAESLGNAIAAVILGSFVLMAFAVVADVYSRIGGVDLFVQLAVVAFLVMLFSIMFAKLASWVTGHA